MDALKEAEESDAVADTGVGQAVASARSHLRMFPILREEGKDRVLSNEMRDVEDVLVGVPRLSKAYADWVSWLLTQPRSRVATSAPVVADSAPAVRVPPYATVEQALADVPAAVAGDARRLILLRQCLKVLLAARDPDTADNLRSLLQELEREAEKQGEDAARDMWFARIRRTGSVDA